MDSFKALIKLWNADKHIPEGESIKSLLPRKKDHIQSLHSFAMQPELISAVKLALSTMGTAWGLLENGISTTEQATLVHGEQLAIEELLLIAHVVPLFIPKELGQDLQASLPNRKRKHENSDGDENDGRTLKEILRMDDGVEYGAVFRSNSPKAKRTRAISISSADSDEDSDEDLSVTSKDDKSAKAHSKKASRESGSPESDGLAGMKSTSADEEGDKKKKEGRKLVKPKIRSKETEGNTDKTEVHD